MVSTAVFTETFWYMHYKNSLKLSIQSRCLLKFQKDPNIYFLQAVTNIPSYSQKNN